MRQFLKHHKTITFAFGLILVLVIVWGLSVILFDFSINLASKTPIQRLDEARATWEAHGSDSYRISIQMFVPLVTVGWFTVTVEHGEVSVSAPSPLETSQFTQNADNLSMPKESTRYTVEGLFDFAASVLPQYPDVPLITTCIAEENVIVYDPEFGYVKSFTIDNCGGGGLLCPQISDCRFGFQITEFELLSG